MPAEATTVVIVDDAPEVRLLVKTRLRMSGALRVVGEGADGAQAIALAQQHHPDLMLLDVSMPGVDGLEALPRVRAVSPGTRVVLFSGFEEQGLVDKAQGLGAAAFIEKSAPVDYLIERLLAVAAGEPPRADVEPAPVGTLAPRETPAPVGTPVPMGTPGPVGTQEAPLGTLAATGPAVVPEEAGPAAPPTAPAPDEEEVGSAPVDQKVLEEHLERFREVFEEAAIGMATVTLTGRLVRTNRALAALVGRPPSGLVGLFYGELMRGQEAALFGALGDIVRGSVDVVQLEHGLTGAAQQRQLRTTLAPVRDSSGRPLYLFLQVQDITAEVAAAEELRRSEERFRLLVEAVEDYAIFMLDPTGHIVSWNSGAQRSKGYTAEEIIGQHFRVFYPPAERARKHPEYELRVALREGHYEEEGWRLRKDGSRFWANVLITAVFNGAGEHVGFAKVTRDTTERRRVAQEREQAAQALAAANAELESLNRRLRQTAEDQAQFLAVTAHELRTPIGVLGGTADMLSRHWAELADEERQELCESMTSSTARLRRLLNDLLMASRLQASALEMHPEPTLLSEVVAHAAATARRTRPDAEIVLDVPPDLVVRADRDRFAQALDNLLSNAIRHGTPPVRVTARARHDEVEVRVSDEGLGVPAAMQPRLFNRFATGSSKGGGTGLGLFIVRELARAQGGDASYEPASPGTPSGAFVITLPRDVSARGPASAGDPAAVGP